MKVISKQVDDLGVCLIDTYRALGDLYTSWDIVPQKPDGSFDRAPDARYGVDQPGGDHEILDFTPMHLYEKITKFDKNGWTVIEVEICDSKGNVIASRKS